MRTILVAAILAAFLPVAGASAASFDPISTAGLGLTRTGLGDAEYARVAALEKTHPRASVGDVIASANRSVTALGSAPKELRGVAGVAGGFRWNKGDSAVSYWYPQGITGSADAVDGGVVDGHRELLVSWYSKNGKGVRVSFVNADKLAKAKYRHVLLVEPKDGGTFGLVKSHAGGIAWYGNYLYVAETHGGLRVFDLRHILRVPKPSEAEGYAFILPQVGQFKTTNAGLVFSYVSVDRTAGPALVTGEYRKGKTGGRIVRWPLDAATGLLRGGGAEAAWSSPATNVQGALTVNGRIGTSSSAGAGNPGVFTTGAPGAAVGRHTWAAGPEDLTYAATSGRVYSVTEHPNARIVFGVKASALGL
ncbi:MAG TPA: hypothetical protein VNS09_16440 [Solirubrobacter sp.]|nr:hypothetical protein [Solirubrobacter sp.]